VPAAVQYATRFDELQHGTAWRLRAMARRAALSALRLAPRRQRQGVRIVHYHYVFEDQRDSFARHVELLARRLTPVSLTEAVRRLRAREVDGDEVVVTFDDGFRNHVTNAAPLLSEYGFEGCFYLISRLVSAPPAEADRICRERILMPRAVEPMTWEEAAELVRLGHEIGSHTRTHPNVAALGPTSLLDELAGSRADLEQKLGRPVTHFSAPFGDRRRFSAVVSEAAQEAGYSSCATALRGINLPGHDPYALRRHHLVAEWLLADVCYFLGLAPAASR